MKTHFKRSTLTLAGALSLALAATSVFAAPQEDAMGKGKTLPTTQPTAPMPSTDSKTTAQVKFDALDVNHDGFVDKQEAAASKALQAQFAKLDANSDNKLSLTEFENVKDLASIKTSGDGYQ